MKLEKGVDKKSSRKVAVEQASDTVSQTPTQIDLEKFSKGTLPPQWLGENFFAEELLGIEKLIMKGV